MKPFRWVLSVVVGVYLLQKVSAAHAADDGRAAYADHLFQEGVQHMKADRCAEAIGDFLRSQQLDPSAGTLVNLATCYARVGRTALAWRTYRQAAAAATAEGDEELKQRAFKAISILDPSLTKLRILAPRGASPMTLTLNGEPLPVDDGLPIPLDPGESIVEAVAPGRQPWRRSVNATELGATIVIEVPDLSPEKKSKELHEWHTAGAITAGVGVAGIVVGSVLGLNAKAKDDESSANCRGSVCNAVGVGLREDAIHNARLSNYFVGLGALAAATGVVLWLTSPAHTEHPVGIAVAAPTPHAPLTLSLEGRL